MTTPREAMHELVKFALGNQACTGGTILKDILADLYSSDHRCKLADVQRLDGRLRGHVASAVSGIGLDHGFWDYEIREYAITIGGEEGAAWLLEQAGYGD